MKDKKKKRRLSKKKITIFICTLLLIISVIVGTVFLLTKDDKTSSSKVKEVKTLETIDEYGYTLKENQTKYYKKLFKELSSVLEAKEIDENKYAELVSKLFVADFYNLENKVSKSDIGGTQFVYEPFREDFEKIAKTTMYNHVESNIYGERNQKLPEVTRVDVTLENGSFTYGDQTDSNAYKASFEIEYAEDLGYQTKGVITLIHNDIKLELAALE